MTADKELRKKIAEKLGWTDLRLSPGGISFIGKAPHDREIHFAPAWEVNIDHALELLARAEQENAGFSLVNIRYHEDQRIAYVCTIYDPWGGPAHREFIREAPTMELAIATAWLAWKESKG